MSHSTQIHLDRAKRTRIIAIHNGDWSGDTLLRVIQDYPEKPSEVITEISLPQEALGLLIGAQLRGSSTEEEIDLATRFYAIGKRLRVRPPCPKCGDQDQSDPRHHPDGTCFICK